MGILKEVSGSDQSLRDLVLGSPEQWGLTWTAESGGLAMLANENGHALFAEPTCDVLLPPVPTRTGASRGRASVFGPLVILRYDAKGQVVELTMHDIAYIERELLLS